jgi:hypothetical protein
VEVSETTFKKLLSKELSPVRAYLTRKVKISGDRDLWRRISLPALKRTGVRLMPLIDQQLPYPSFTTLQFIKRNAPGWAVDLPNCMLCGYLFSSIHRKHHCRVCTFGFVLSCSVSVK